MMEDGNTESSKLPPLYCDPKKYGQNMLVMDWILAKSNSDLKEEVEFKYYSLPALLFNLAKVSVSSSSSSKSSIKSGNTESCKVPTINIAEDHLNRDTFMYLTDCCDWHRESDVGRYYCCQAIVLGYSFILFSLVCPLHSIPLRAGPHFPPGYSRPDLVKKTTSTSTSSRDRTRAVPGPGSSSSRIASESSRSESIYKSGSYSTTGSTASQV